MISYILRWGKVSVKCYVVIDHIAIGHPYQTIWNTFKVFHTVILLIKSRVLLLIKSRVLLLVKGIKSRVLLLVKGRNTIYNWLY